MKKSIFTPEVYSYLKQILILSEDILGKVPNNGDNLPNQIVKGVAIVESISSFFTGRGSLAYLKTLNLKEVHNRQFRDLFFTSFKGGDEVKISKMSVIDYEEIIVATIDGVGKLYFIENIHGWSHPSFFHTPDFDFKKFLQLNWDKYDGRIWISIPSSEASDDKKTEFIKFPKSTKEIYGQALTLLDKMICQDSLYREDGITRAYLLVGAPGTGKSSFAYRLASHKSKKILKIDAGSLSNVRPDNIGFILEGLSPEYMIIDDIDHADLQLATLLSVIDMIKESHKDMVLILTANDATKLGPALLRPDRIDEIIKFGFLSPEERNNILGEYIIKFNSEINDNDKQVIIDMTDELSAAYLREIAIQTKYKSFDELKSYISNMKEFLAESKKENAESKKENNE